MFKHNIKAVLNTQRPDKDGKFPLRIRTTIQRKVTYYPTGIMLLKENWDGSEVIKLINRSLQNVAIRDKINEIEKALLELSISGEETIKAKVNSKLTFSEYATKVINDWTGNYGEDTIKHRWSFLRRVNDCLPGIKLKDINKDALLKIEAYCRSQGNTNNTIVSYTKFIRTIINAATKEKVLLANELKGVKSVRYKNILRNSPSPEEVERIEAFAVNPKNSPALTNIANWFLFSCYCGLRYGDMARFKGFKNGKVLLQTEKTKEIVSIFATNKIIETRKRITDVILSNQKTNAYLKLIAVACNIEHYLTFHQSRHYFAIQFLERGGRLEVLQSILGHSSIKSTQIYAKISTKMADAEMKKVWD